MPRLINLASQKNCWGTTTEEGLEPQRNDLWLVDLSEVVKGLDKLRLFYKVGVSNAPVFLPQFVQSVTLPEQKIKAEVFRRDSVPFNLPSWDEPLDATKIVFLLDTQERVNQSVVLAIMKAWTLAVRAGRGNRTDGPYATTKNSVTLDATFRYDYAFSVRIALLRGGKGETTEPNDAQMVQMNTPTKRTQGQQKARPLTQISRLQYSGNWLLKDAWLGGWKMSDLNYTTSGLVTVEATLYAESLEESAVF